MARYLLLLALGSGCGLVHRQARFLGPEQMAIVHREPLGLLEAEIEEKRSVRTAEAPGFLSRGGRYYTRPVVLGDGQTLVLGTQSSEPVALRMYIRGNGLFDRHDFRRVHTLTGTLERRFPNELILLPENLDAPVRLAMGDLANPFNNDDFDHGDLLLVVAEQGGLSERRLFKRRDSGLHVGSFAGLLATIPLREDQASVAPILAVGPTFGWRSERSSGPLVALDTLELVVSAGLGSTALETVVQQDDVDDQVSGLFNATLVGGGLRVFKVVTVQGYINTSQFFRNAREAPATLAVGVDATGLAAATRDIFSRLIKEHPVRERNEQR